MSNPGAGSGPDLADAAIWSTCDLHGDLVSEDPASDQRPVTNTCDLELDFAAAVRVHGSVGPGLDSADLPASKLLVETTHVTKRAPTNTCTLITIIVGT